MEYKQCIVRAFEQAPGKWRASVKRSDGKPLMVVSRFKLAQFVTGIDSLTAKDALQMAVAAIDAGAFFSRRAALEQTSSSRREIEAGNRQRLALIRRGRPALPCSQCKEAPSAEGFHTFGARGRRRATQDIGHAAPRISEHAPTGNSTAITD